MWLYERESLRFFALRGAAEPRYVEVPCSELLPELPVELLLAAVKAPSQLAAVRALRAALEGNSEPAS